MPAAVMPKRRSHSEQRRHQAATYHENEQVRERPGHEYGSRKGKRGGSRTWWFKLKAQAERDGWLTEFFDTYEQPPKNPKPGDEDFEEGR